MLTRAMKRIERDPFDCAGASLRMTDCGFVILSEGGVKVEESVRFVSWHCIAFGGIF